MCVRIGVADLGGRILKWPKSDEKLMFVRTWHLGAAGGEIGHGMSQIKSKMSVSGRGWSSSIALVCRLSGSHFEMDFGAEDRPVQLPNFLKKK